MPALKAFFNLSTKIVDNFVGKYLLTALKPRLHAHFNTMIKWRAKYNSFKINDLQKHICNKKYLSK